MKLQKTVQLHDFFHLWLKGTCAEGRSREESLCSIPCIDLHSKVTRQTTLYRTNHYIHSGRIMGITMPTSSADAKSNIIKSTKTYTTGEVAPMKARFLLKRKNRICKHYTLVKNGFSCADRGFFFF